MKRPYDNGERAKRKARYERNKAHILEVSKRYRQAHPEACRAGRVRWVAANPERAKEIRAICRINRKPKRPLYDKHRRETQPERVKAIKHTSYIRRRHVSAAYDKQYREENRARLTTKENRRRAMYLCAMPAWADKSKIAEWYEARAFAEEFFGLDIHVDHVIPLQGRAVCGLHVHNNLQLLTASQNSQKGNRLYSGLP